MIQAWESGVSRWDAARYWRTQLRQTMAFTVAIQNAVHGLQSSTKFIAFSKSRPDGWGRGGPGFQAAKPCPSDLGGPPLRSGEPGTGRGAQSRGAWPAFLGCQSHGRSSFQVGTPPPPQRGSAGGEEGLGCDCPPLHLSHGRSATKTTALAVAGTSGQETRGPCYSPHPMEESFLESFGRLSLQQPQPRPPPPRGTPPRRHSFRKHLYLLRGLPGSGKTTLAR